MNLFVSILVTFICLPWSGMVMMSPMMIAASGFADKKSSILTAILFFIYPSFVFMILHQMGYMFYGTNALRWAVVMFILGFLITLLYRLPRLFYNLSIGVSNCDYFIKNNLVYFNGKRIKGADANSFTNFNNRGYYSKDKNHVYYNNKKITTADATTFKPLENDKSTNYWHDKNIAFYKWDKIEGADGGSFVCAGNNYAFDKENVFFEKQLLKEADRATFKPLMECVGRDCKNIFVRSILVTNIKDIASFELITISEEVFGKDNEQIYVLRYVPPFPLIPFPNADIETFEVVGEYYAKDKNQVYYYGYGNNDILVLENANPENFRLFFDSIRSTNATDGLHYYKSGVLFSV